MSNNYVGLHQYEKSGIAGRCAQRLLALRQSLEPVRQRKRDGALLLATWNIRDFDANRFGWGPRLAESFYYIAEILSCFDLVAVQEVNRDLSALNRVMSILGREWDYVATDATEGSGGNDERLAFVYNTEKVWFRKIAGEVVLPDGQLIVSRRKALSGRTTSAPREGAVEEAVNSGFEEVRHQFARTPFVVAFQSGWFKFNLCTVHIYYGAESGEQLQRRIAEIERLVGFFADRQDNENKKATTDPSTQENYILLGDFNVVSPDHETMQALRSHGFVIPDEIDGPKVRTIRENYYDQIAVRVRNPLFHVAGGGIIDIYHDVFRDNDEDRATYAAHVPAEDLDQNEKEHKEHEDEDDRATPPEERYCKWRTWQMSDHKPLWMEIETDFTDHYLAEFASQTG